MGAKKDAGLAHYESTVYIDATPEAVWDFLLDIDRYPEWIGVVDEITSKDDAPVAVGSRYSDYGGPFDQAKRTIDWRFTEVDRVARLARTGTGPGLAGIQVEYTLSQTNSGTTVHNVIDTHAAWYMLPVVWLMEALFIKRLSQRTLEESLRKAKELIEES